MRSITARVPTCTLLAGNPARPWAIEYPLAVSSMSEARLDVMVEEATVDCHDEDEQVSGLFTMIEDNLTVPFETMVLNVAVTVESVELTDAGQIVAIYRHDQVRQAISILDLPLPTPPPEGAEWIDAYRYWLP